MHVGLVGCGLIGQKRAESLPPRYLHAVADTSKERAEYLAGKYPGVTAYTDWQKLVQRDDLDIIIVSTTNNWLAPITLSAINAGKHVLVEKPAARYLTELDSVIEAAENKMLRLWWVITCDLIHHFRNHGK